MCWLIAQNFTTCGYNVIKYEKVLICKQRTVAGHHGHGQTSDPITVLQHITLWIGLQLKPQFNYRFSQTL